MRCTLTLALPLVVALVARPAGATQWTVDASAAAGGNGSPQSPFKTLTQAAAVLATGDTVLVRAGTYNESVSFYQVKQGAGGRTTIKAAPGATPIIDGGGSAGFVLEAGETPNMTFEGLTIRNTTGSGILFSKSHDGQVLSCTTQNTAAGVTFYLSDRGEVKGCDLVGGVSGKTTDGTLIHESKIHGGSGMGIYLHAGSKSCKCTANEIYDNTPNNIYIDSSSDVTLDRNMIYMTGAPPTDHAAILLADEKYPNVTAPLLDKITITNNVMLNNGLGVAFWSGDFPGSSGMKNTRIANNTIVNSAEAAISWDPGAHSAVIQNNILADDGKGSASMLLMAKSTTGVTLDHNLWDIPWVNDFIHWGGTAMTHYAWKQAASQGAGDVLATPGFAGPYAPPAQSFKLQPGSAAIDVGQALAFVTQDYEGSPRPAGAGYDIGAFERGGAATPDGGPTPDGTGIGDAGTIKPDALSTTDSGGGTDSGGTPSGSSEGGCSCALPGRGAPPADAGALLLLLTLLWRRRG